MSQIEDVIKVRSSVTEELKRYMLFKGTLLALLGVIPILLAGTSLPPASLKFWGLPIFIGGGILVTWGLLPYRKICRLETKPAEIVIDQSRHITYVESGTPTFSIPLDSIQQIEFATKGKRYGIRLVLKERILFIPYFSKRSAMKLADYL